MSAWRQTWLVKNATAAFSSLMLFCIWHAWISDHSPAMKSVLVPGEGSDAGLKSNTLTFMDRRKVIKHVLPPCESHLPIEILALDVGTDEWDWIDVEGHCNSACKVTPCCRNGNRPGEQMVCNSIDVARAHAVTFHMEWYARRIVEGGGNCGRTCCSSFLDQTLPQQAKITVGVQNEANTWGHNSNPKAIATLSYFLTFQPAWHVNYNQSIHGGNTKIIHYEFAEPAWAFNSTLLSQPGGAANHPLVRKWKNLAPGPSSKSSVSLFNSNCGGFMQSVVSEFQKHGIVVDGYGECFHSRDSGFEMSKWSKDMYIKKLAVMSGHMFDLAIENDQISSWWNTERVYHALLVHTIPIYGGSSTSLRRIPHRDSIIRIADFPNISALAQYVQKVAEDPVLQERHLRWTKYPPALWENGFPTRQKDFSRLSGVMCNVCESIRDSIQQECLEKHRHNNYLNDNSTS